MISTPNTAGRIFKQIWSGFFSMTFIMGMMTNLFASEPKYIDIKAASSISANKEISVHFSLLDSERNLVKNENRQLIIDIVNNDLVDSKSIRLEKGQADLTLIFKKPGATLLTIHDTNIKGLVHYWGFDVQERVGEK